MSPIEIIFNSLNVIIPLLLVASVTSLMYSIALMVKGRFTIKKIAPLVCFIALTVGLSIWQKKLQMQFAAKMLREEFLPVLDQIAYYVQRL